MGPTMRSARWMGASLRAARWGRVDIRQVAMRPDKAWPLLPVIWRLPALLTLGARLSGKTTQVVAAA
jgi:hypothetical protein